MKIVPNKMYLVRFRQKIDSLLFRAPEPFHPRRLWDFLDKAVTEYGVLRSKGFLWLATRPGMIGLWSQAGPHGRCDLAGAPIVVSGEWPDDPDERADLEQRWHPVFGDRRQELVFIGVRLPADELHEGLRRCLLTDDELAVGEEVWRTWPDPFPEWPLDEVQPHAHQHGEKHWRSLPDTFQRAYPSVAAGV